ncbi:MAG: 30S ribosomal protein S18 [Spiroplasmataceae bacterium]|jgi:small subunit ribosomal protein S18|nr:30S ribosomal protein S18 [Spiroplasmataceae bacterium]
MIKSNLERTKKTKKKKNSIQTDYFLNQGIDYIDYKDVTNLSKFIDSQGKINPRKQNKLTAKSQRQLSIAIKRSRQMALLPHIIVEQNK